MRIHCFVDKPHLQSLLGDSTLFRLDVREARLRLPSLRERIPDICRALFIFPPANDYLSRKDRHYQREYERGLVS